MWNEDQRIGCLIFFLPIADRLPFPETSLFNIKKGLQAAKPRQVLDQEKCKGDK